MHWFVDLADAKEKLEASRREYNEILPHRSLNELSPLEYKANWAPTKVRKSLTIWIRIGGPLRIAMH